MIDLHILNHPPATTPEWWERCLASVANVEQYGVTLHIVDNPGTSLGAARARAYRLGTQPYVACLDSDDILVPEAIPVLLHVLKDNPHLCGAYSDRVNIDMEGNEIFRKWRGPWTAKEQLRGLNYPHQLAIMRREAVEPHLDAISDFEEYQDYTLAGLVTYYGPWCCVPVIGYIRQEKKYYRNHGTPISGEFRQRALRLVHLPLHKHIIDSLVKQREAL